MKTYVHADTCTRVFTAAKKVETAQVAIDGKMDKQNMVHSHNGTSLSHKRNKALTHTTMRVSLENIMPNESGQTPKATCCMTPFK